MSRSPDHEAVQRAVREINEHWRGEQYDQIGTLVADEAVIAAPGFGSRIRGRSAYVRSCRDSPELVFKALDTEEGRAAFWAESASESDGKIEFRFINGVTCVSKVLERHPPQTFAVDYMGGPAVFELTSDGAGGTDLLLTHEGVTAADWNEMHAGWLNVLFPLKAWLCSGRITSVTLAGEQALVPEAPAAETHHGQEACDHGKWTRSRHRQDVSRGLAREAVRNNDHWRSRLKHNPSGGQWIT